MGCTGIAFMLKSSFSRGRAQQLLASPRVESRTGSQGLRTCRKGKAKLKARGPPQDSLLAPLGLTRTQGVLRASPWSPAAEGAPPPPQPCVAKTQTLAILPGSVHTPQGGTLT